MVDVNIIQKLAEQKGLSIAALERRADIANGSIRRWETSSPSIDILWKVADVLQCRIDDLLKKEEMR